MAKAGSRSAGDGPTGQRRQRLTKDRTREVGEEFRGERDVAHVDALVGGMDQGMLSSSDWWRWGKKP